MLPRARWKFPPACTVPRQRDGRVTYQLVFLGTATSLSIPHAARCVPGCLQSSLCLKSTAQPRGRAAGTGAPCQTASQTVGSKRFGSVFVGCYWERFGLLRGGRGNAFSFLITSKVSCAIFDNYLMIYKRWEK